MERTRVSVRTIDAPESRRAVGLALAMIAALAVLQPEPARAQAARPVGQDASKSSLARYVPKQDLIYYAEFDGVDAHADAWKKSAAYKLLNDTKLGALIEDLAGQGIELAQQSAPPQKRIKPAELIGLFKHVWKHGGAIAGWGPAGEPNAGVVFVARGADRPEIIRLLQLATSGRAEGPPLKKAGRTIHPLGQAPHAPQAVGDPPVAKAAEAPVEEAAWWIEKGDLVISSKPDLIFSVLDGQSPNVVDHPIRTALLRKSDGFEPIAAGFFDVTALPPLPPQAAQLGLDGAKRIEIQWGIQDDALLAVVGVVAPQPRRGLLAMLDQPTFTIQSLPPMPAELNGFVVLSLDPARIYDQFVALTKQANPGGGEGFARLEQAVRQRFGFDLRTDLLAQLGPRFALYSAAPAAAPAADPATAMMAQFTGLTIAAQARDESVARNLDKLVEAINLIIASQQAAARRGPPGPNGGVIGLHKLDAKRPTYVLDLPAGAIPPQILAMYRPTVELGKGQLVFAATTEAADQAADLGGLPADRLWKPTDAFIPMARRVPRDLVFLGVSDARDTLPAGIEALPIIAAQLNLLFPAVNAAREAARRAQCTNNFRQIAIGLLGYANANNGFPAPSIVDKEGKPTLSWRVAILPFIDQQALYDKFHLDEPWDSPHNKPLIDAMPQVFVCPSRADAAPGTTTYRVFTGPGTLFEAGKSTRLTSVIDGTSSTILAVESREAVPWTRPDTDLPFDPAAAPSLYGAGSPHPGGFLMAMADASVFTVADTIDPKVFRNLITRNGREVLNRDAIPSPAPARPGRQGGVIHVDPDLLPRADELKPLLFPGSLAVASDREGIRIVSREPFPTMSPTATSGVLVALLLPAVQAAREASRRAQCVNNLKQIALAMLNYESANGAFPRPATTDKAGKPLLSWRVAILPYIEQQGLYNKFHLDEPWDSPHNKALINEMPPQYLCPTRANVQPGTTNYRAFVGGGAFFDQDEATKIANITDGTSNTIMVVEASEAVPWTRPDSDLPFDPEAKPSLHGAGSSHPGGFNAMFCDGSVRFISKTVDLTVFKALITRAGGEPFNVGAPR